MVRFTILNFAQSTTVTAHNKLLHDTIGISNPPPAFSRQLKVVCKFAMDDDQRLMLLGEGRCYHQFIRKPAAKWTPKFYGVFESPLQGSSQLQCLVTEYCEGETLSLKMLPYGANTDFLRESSKQLKMEIGKACLAVHGAGICFNWLTDNSCHLIKLTNSRVVIAGFERFSNMKNCGCSADLSCLSLDSIFHKIPSPSALCGDIELPLTYVGILKPTWIHWHGQFHDFIVRDDAAAFTPEDLVHQAPYEYISVSTSSSGPLEEANYAIREHCREWYPQLDNVNIEDGGTATFPLEIATALIVKGHDSDST
ncbi:hypothetical protein HYDPIDRAFT_186203 [Hydnomerulius pinastri MD-312]|nr:hypothetical protein HYDPIDRAFT_186203 [Hydnomerulius pinastri MD-312]